MPFRVLSIVLRIAAIVLVVASPWLAPRKRPSDDRVTEFVDRVRAGNVAVFVRRSRGDDIDAACGQLAAKGAAEPGDDAPIPSARLAASRDRATSS